MTLGRKNKERDMRSVRGAMMSIPPQHYATAALAAGGTALTVNSVPNWTRQAGGWAVVGAGGTAAIVRKVAASAITGNQITWSGTAEYAHSAGDPVLFIDRLELQAAWFGADLSGATSSNTAFARAVAQLTTLGGGTLRATGPATYEVDQIALDDNITFIIDRGAVIKNEDYDYPTIYADSKDNIYIGGGGAIDGVSPTGGGSNHFGIGLTDCTNWTIENLSVYNFQRHGIRIFGSDSSSGNFRGVIRDCFVYNNKWVGIWVFRANDYIVISGNQCYHNGWSGIGIDDSSTTDTLITQQEPCRHGSISDNVCRDNTLAGIFLAGADGWSIHDNQCISNGINEYYSMTRAGDGIFLETSQNKWMSKLLDVHDNICAGNYRHGIYARGVVRSKIHDNICSNNGVSGVAGNPGYGIHLMSHTDSSNLPIYPANKVFHYDDSGASYTDLTNAYDDDEDTGSTVSIDTSDLIYIQVAELCGKLRVYFGATVNAEAATLTAKIYDGSTWIDVSATDGTASGGATFAQDGYITFLIPHTRDTGGNGWSQTTVNSVSGYWVQLSFSAALTASVVIDEIRQMSGSSFNDIDGNLLTFDTNATSVNSEKGINLNDDGCQWNNIRNNTFKRYESGTWATITNNGLATYISSDNRGHNRGVEYFADGDTTPSVATGGVMYGYNTASAVSITTFDNAEYHQRVLFRAGNGNVTFKDVSTTGSFQLAGGSDYNIPTNGMIEFIYSGGYWFEITRSAD